LRIGREGKRTIGRDGRGRKVWEGGEGQEGERGRVGKEFPTVTITSR